MTDWNDDPFDAYVVVVNDEEQYSIWPAAKREVPAGWHPVGFEGTKPECLDHIEKVWTDIRPRSLRESSLQENG